MKKIAIGISSFWFLCCIRYLYKGYVAIIDYFQPETTIIFLILAIFTVILGIGTLLIGIQLDTNMINKEIYNISETIYIEKNANKE